MKGDRKVRYHWNDKDGHRRSTVKWRPDGPALLRNITTAGGSDLRWADLGSDRWHTGGAR